MEFKNYKYKLFFHLALLILCIVLTTWLIGNQYFIFFTFFLSIVAVVQLVSINALFDKTLKDVKYFLGCIQYEDFTSRFPSKKQSKLVSNLYDQYNQILADFQLKKRGKESKLLFYQSILQEIETGILVFNASHEIKVANSAFYKILGFNKINSILSIKEYQFELYQAIVSLKSHEKLVLKLNLKSEKISVRVSIVDIVSNGELLKLLTIQNIQNELDKNQMDAWQTMISVLTHEIMNSLTPITSLSNTVNSQIKSWNISENELLSLSKSEKDDIVLSMDVIKQRSEGLMQFVNDFRTLSHIPNPKIDVVSVNTLVSHVLTLMKSDLEKKNVKVSHQIEPETIHIRADAALIEQVLINIIKNGMESVEEENDKKPIIHIKAFNNNHGLVEIWVQDNGTGILPEVMEKVFIPFYSTKRTGSGIGLSICKQIMQLHNGKIKIESEFGKGTTLKLIF